MRLSETGVLRFDCTTPDCGWSDWVAASFDPDARPGEATIPGGRPSCPRCGCRTVPDWTTGPRMGAPR